MQMLPFTLRTYTLPISVTSTASTSTALPNLGNTLRVVNAGPNIAYISVGSGSQTATVPNATTTVTSVPVLAGSDVSFGISNAAVLNISAICDTNNTATLYVSVGDGA